MTTATGPHIGANLDKYSDASEHALGSVQNGISGKQFRYVQFQDAIPYQVGDVCTFGLTGTDTWRVTNDRVGGSAAAGFGVAGVLHGPNVPTQNQYGWLQFEGECSPRGTYAAGNQLVPHATLDGQAVVSGYTAAAADFNIFARAHSSSRAVLSIR